MIFFTDRDLGKRIFPSILRDAGLAVERHADHFRDDEPDDVWVPAVAGRGWIILSSDQRMRRVSLERDAIMTSGAAMFMLVGGDAPAAELARNVVNTLPRIERFISRHHPPFIAKIYRPNPRELISQGKPGSIEMRLSREEWEQRYRP